MGVQILSRSPGHRAGVFVLYRTILSGPLARSPTGARLPRSRNLAVVLWPAFGRGLAALCSERSSIWLAFGKISGQRKRSIQGLPGAGDRRMRIGDCRQNKVGLIDEAM